MSLEAVSLEYHSALPSLTSSNDTHHGLPLETVHETHERPGAAAPATNEEQPRITWRGRAATKERTTTNHTNYTNEKTADYADTRGKDHLPFATF
jgi:hypothetical protein